MKLEGKTILVIGGAGSFGQKFTQVVLKECHPSSVRIYDHNELGVVEAQRKFDDQRLRFFIGDVRDRDRLSRAMEGVDVVVHAAALKHVPVAEYNPIEVIKTNILGTANVVDAAIDTNVRKVFFISTDKAVNPANLYGATKLCAERLCIQANSYVGGRETSFACARYGNVLASSGSVVPIFLEQKQKGLLTITDERMTRFWITLGQGVNFVLRCIEQMKGGEVFVPKISSMKIVDLADVIAPEATKKIIGVRPGEKLHEVLITEEEARRTREFDDYYVIEPDFPFWKENKGLQEGKMVAEGFRYASDTNDRWLTKEELRKIVEEL